jgi:hypothetical protein
MGLSMSARPAQLLLSVFTFGVLLLAPGCGTSERPEESLTGTPTPKVALEDLGQLLAYLAREKKPMPATIRSIEPIEPLYPQAYLGLVRDEIVYRWNARPDPAGSEKVIAYEKKALEEGGWALMQDGTVKKMTADELRAAPKAI